MLIILAFSTFYVFIIYVASYLKPVELTQRRCTAPPPTHFAFDLIRVTHDLIEQMILIYRKMNTE